MDTIEFEYRNGKTWLRVNAELCSVCDKTGLDCRSYLFCDYLLTQHLQSLKEKKIDLFKNNMELHELEQVAKRLGLKTVWQGEYNLVVIRE